MNKTDIDIVIISYNTADLTLECIKSVIYSAYDLNFSIIVVDNHSSDNTVERIETLYPEIHLIQNAENLGYSKAVNIGVRNSNAPYVIASNSDVIFLKDSIHHLINTLKQNKFYAASGPQQIFPNYTWQKSYGLYPSILEGIRNVLQLNFFEKYWMSKVFNYKKPIQKIKYVQMLDGAVLCFNKEIFEQVGGFDEDYFFYSEETDFCFRVNKLAYKLCFVPTSQVIHYRGASNSSSEINYKSIEMLTLSKSLFLKKHYSEVSRKAFFLLQAIYFLELIIIFSFLGKNNQSKVQTYKYFFKLNWELFLNGDKK